MDIPCARKFSFTRPRKGETRGCRSKNKCSHFHVQFMKRCNCRCSCLICNSLTFSMRCLNFIVITMVFFCLAAFMLGVLLTKPPCAAETPCGVGRVCPSGWFCCGDDCCESPTFNPRRIANDSLREVFATSWYSQWQVLFLLMTLGGIALCCAWCLSRRPSCACALWCCARARSERDSAGSVCAPPRYSRCSSVHRAPPPYAEVTSKPDLYPLVITCGEGDGKAGGSYLMVHYFRNYVIRAPGSLSATSTAESLNSSFICNAANEANTQTLSVQKTHAAEHSPTDSETHHNVRPTQAQFAIRKANTMVPPPYSCASSCSCARGLRDLADAESRRREHGSSPDQNYDLDLEMTDCEMYSDGGCKPRLGSSPPPRRASPNADDSYCERAAYLRHLFLMSPDTPGGRESPPQPTSPTQSRESTLRRQIDERCQRRHDFFRRPARTRKSSLYIPLSKVPSGSRKFLTRSAPATPSGALVPNLLTFTQRVSASRLSSRSSRLEEENDPLLADGEPAENDHKF